jgi:hypothetical protein
LRTDEGIGGFMTLRPWTSAWSVSRPVGLDARTARLLVTTATDSSLGRANSMGSTKSISMGGRM